MPTAGLTGKGVTVAVIDTGIDPHPDLVRPESRLAGWHDLVAGKPEPYDDDGHGTHVAGIIAGNGFASGGNMWGVAPGSLLVGVKVLDQDGGGPISRVIAGIQWVVENREKPEYQSNQPFPGRAGGKGYKKDPLSRAVEEAWRRGLVVLRGRRQPGPRRRDHHHSGDQPVGDHRW